MSSSRPDAVETMTQWGIKLISSRVIEEIKAEAHDLKLTHGQMIEKVWDERKAGGVVVQHVVNPVDDLVRLGAAFAPWGENVPGEVRKLINAHARVARGLQPGITERASLRLPAPVNGLSTALSTESGESSS